MDIVMERVGEVQVVRLSGELDAKTSPDAQARILELLQSGDRMILDMEEVRFVSSAGLRMLLVLYRQFAANQGRLVLVGLSDRVRDTMDTTGFLAHFATFGDLEAGLAALK